MDKLNKDEVAETQYDINLKQRDWVFTLHNYTEEDITKIRSLKTLYQVFGKEIAPEKGTPHLQGYFYFAGATTKQQLLKRIKKLSLSNEMYVAPRFKKSTPTQASDYCKKNKPKEDIYENGVLPNGANQGHRTDIDELYHAIKDGKSWEEIHNDYYPLMCRYRNNIKGLYDTLSPKKEFDLTKEYPVLRPFQQDIITYVSHQPDKRKVLWIVDKTGGSGKSELADYLVSKYNFKKINNCKTSDIAYAWNGENIVMDLSRTTEDHINYEAMEQLKNGTIFSPKYESCSKRFERPHLIVMANFPPEKTAMSLDRWDIRYVNDKYELTPETSLKEEDDEPVIVVQTTIDKEFVEGLKELNQVIKKTEPSTYQVSNMLQKLLKPTIIKDCERQRTTIRSIGKRKTKSYSQP